MLGFGPMPLGTPEQVADVMEQWFTEGGIDGFNISCGFPLSATEGRLLLMPNNRHVQP
jgi:alkanesulfonate monooxygenase SsuD/methylene tetrahydromethanopterin reductase-like flavin-dependent oxidoreductase (luciferase family)